MGQESSKKRWLIKDREARVRGPFYTDEILKKITQGEFGGDEFIALYPSTNWIPISHDPDFYDKLLESLDSEHAKVKDEVQAPLEMDPVELPSDDFVEKPVEKSQVPPPKSRAEKVSEKKSEPTVDQPNRDHHENKVPDIELKKSRKAIKNVKAKTLRAPGLVIILILVVVAFVLFSGGLSKGQLWLLPPRSGQPSLSSEQIKAKSQKAVGAYVKDTFSNYMTAQTELVQILEGAPSNAGVVALTCLTYFELWPFVEQDAKDLHTISIVSQMASKIDPAGIESATCRVVDLMIRGRYIEAKGLVETTLDTHSRSGQPPIAFYYLKAKLYEIEKDYTASVSYAQSAQQLWPAWLRPQVLEGQSLVAAGRYQEAANKLRAVLKTNPQHVVAQIELGLLEFQHLKNYQVGQKWLESALKQNEKAPREVLSRGYRGLAEIALKNQNKSTALDYAQKAYELNTSDRRAKEIIVMIGGAQKLKTTNMNDRQYMYEADQMVREGDCNAAQAHYKMAYEVNKKNALAAMKAAECLWEISLSSEAIQWLDKAIRVDPDMIDAYILLADYYTQRHNYLGAIQIMTKAKSQAPKSYKVYRGFALIELRRNNAKGSVGFAERAIQLYEADIESYVLLARAQIRLQNFAKAFEAASKAVEIDLNHREAQVVYAEALAGARGMSVGIDYLSRLVNTYPTITDYRLGLGELYVKDQRYSAAQEIFSQVIRMDEKPKKAYIALGNIFRVQRKFNEARDAYFAAAKVDPSDVEALFLAGQLYLESKQAGEARNQFQRVLRINKDYPLVHYYIGRAALQTGDLEEALEEAKKEKALNPNLADPYLLAADAYTEMKQYSSCAGEYLYAVKLRPQGSDIYVKMARCYRMAGNLDAAVSMINQANLLESGNPEVWKEQGSIYDVRQENIKAIEAYSQYLVLSPNAPDREQIQMRINSLSR